MESNSKSMPSEKAKEKKNFAPKKKSAAQKKKNKCISKAKASQSSASGSSTSKKSSSNLNQSAGKSSRHSDHNDRRDQYHYHRHSSQRDHSREKSYYNNTNYDSDRNKRPFQSRNSSSGSTSYSNRVWKRPYTNHHSKNNRYQNSNYQKFNNFQRDPGGSKYNQQSRPQIQPPSDSFHNFQLPFNSLDDQNFWEDTIVGQFPEPDTLPSVIQRATQIIVNLGISGDSGEPEVGNQNQGIAFNPNESSLISENQVFEKNRPQETLTSQNQEIPSEQFEQIKEPDQPFKQFNECRKQNSLTYQSQNVQLEQISENYLQGVLTNENQAFSTDQREHLNDSYAEEFPENSEAIDQSTSYPFAIKTELPESEFTLQNCINSNNSFSSISVIPISRLIKSEIQDLNRSDIIAPTTPNRGKRLLRPNLVQRKKSITKDGSVSENIVQRVANMDKVGIKNVINSSGTKYDAALKIQARKKLREEIRKQLKSMNFTPPEDCENNVLIPDEIVDSMNIPTVVLDEIRKAFGIVLLEDKNSKILDGDAKSVSPPATAEAVAVEPATQPETEGPSRSPDLMSRLKMLEECKSHSEKSPNMVEKATRRSKSTEPILIIDSSSSSSSGSSSSSDSDSSSTSSGSNCSTTSSFKRRRRKKRILEANVVGNFEKLILPNLTLAQRRRYKEKYSKTTKNSLLYIYGVCVSRANRNKSSAADEKEQLKVKKNLSSADNAQALEFLMKAILSLFEKQKETLKKSKAKKTTSTSTSKSELRSPSNPVSRAVNKSKDSTCNQQKSSDDDRVSTRSRRSESANSVQLLPKHQSTHKLDEASTTKGSRGNKSQKDYIAAASESANSSKRVSSSDDGMAPVVAESFESDTESTSDKNPPSQIWKSPGEKKCIDIESTSPLSNLGALKSPSQMETAMTSLGMMQSPLANFSFDLESLKSQSSIGDEAVSNIREIDVKLMELHKRKMYIEEMILKLQKDKMEVDLWTMKLQNEKFILLNSALASASTRPASPKAAPVKRKVIQIPFADKLENRKKRSLLNAITTIVQAKQSKRKSISMDEENNSEDKASTPSKKTRSSAKSTAEDSSDKVLTKKESKSEKTEEIVKNVEEQKIEEAEEQYVKTIPEVDYTNVTNGNLEGWKLPITQIIVVGEAIIAASEDGNIYKFNIRTRVLESKFSKHTEAITQIFTCPRENFVYTTSLDGFLKKTSIENFGLELQSLNLQEPLQSIDIEWSTAFIGSRWGNIFTYDIKNNNLSESLLCSSGSSIIAIKATKEGPRKILIVSSKGNQMNFRDAMTGLLLRSLDISDNLHIYSILLDDGCIYLGTQRNEIHHFNFTTGGRLGIFHCGNGAVSMKLYKDKYIFVGCYDGFVYVLDKKTGCQIGRFPGSGKMILALEIAGDKLITSAKDNSMQIIDIPNYIATIKDKS